MVVLCHANRLFSIHEIQRFRQSIKERKMRPFLGCWRDEITFRGLKKTKRQRHWMVIVSQIVLTTHRIRAMPCGLSNKMHFYHPCICRLSKGCTVHNLNQSRSLMICMTQGKGKGDWALLAPPVKCDEGEFSFSFMVLFRFLVVSPFHSPTFDSIPRN